MKRRSDDSAVGIGIGGREATASKKPRREE